MKKIYFSLLMICLIALSCKKEGKKSVTPNNGLQKVTFNVGFSKTVTKLQNSSRLQINSLQTNSTTDTSLTNYISVLWYMVFDSNGNNVHNIEQLSTDTAFGHYVDYLQPGTYTVAVAGGESSFMVQPGTLSTEYLFYGVLYGTGIEYWPGNWNQDAFFAKNNITISSGPTSSQGFSLNRIVSQLVVNINDDIPTGAQNARLTVGYGANMYYVGNGSTAVFDQTTGQPNTTGYSSNIYEYVVPTSFYGQPNYQMKTLFLYNPSYPLAVDIMVYTSGGVIYGEKDVDNITGAPNQITLLSGDLFGTSSTTSTGGFQLSTDTIWNTPVVKTFP